MIFSGSGNKWRAAGSYEISSGKCVRCDSTDRDTTNCSILLRGYIILLLLSADGGGLDGSNSFAAGSSIAFDEASFD